MWGVSEGEIAGEESVGGEEAEAVASLGEVLEVELEEVVALFAALFALQANGPRRIQYQYRNPIFFRTHIAYPNQSPLLGIGHYGQLISAAVGRVVVVRTLVAPHRPQDKIFYFGTFHYHNSIRKNGNF